MCSRAFNCCEALPQPETETFAMDFGQKNTLRPRTYVYQSRSDALDHPKGEGVQKIRSVHPRVARSLVPDIGMRHEKGMNADGTGKVFDGSMVPGSTSRADYIISLEGDRDAIPGCGAGEKEDGRREGRKGERSACFSGGEVVLALSLFLSLIREPINATILRQSIIIFPICIATELLFKSAPPGFDPFGNPLQIPAPAASPRDSSSGTSYRFCYAVGFFPS